MPEPTVWIINRSSHDYSAAMRFGKLEFLSEGTINKFNVNDMDRQFRERLADSSPNDYLLLTSLTVMSAIATVVFVEKHGKLNLLLFRSGDYIERRLSYCGSKS